MVRDAGATRVGLAGAAVMGVAFGMVRYVYGLTLPEVRADLGLGELVLGLVASGTYAGFLVALIAAPALASRLGPRAATTLGGVCGALGCALVALASSPWALGVGGLIAGSSAGWVWAPYSDIVAAVAPTEDRPWLLSWITTGASAGLVLVAPLALLAGTWGSWRWTWGAIASASVLAAVLNRWWVPVVPPARRSSGRSISRSSSRSTSPLRAIVRPLVLAAMLFAGATAYLTYAPDAVRGGLGAAAGPVIFMVAGLAGLVGSTTGRLAARRGTGTVGAGALGAVGLALVLLGVGPGSSVGVLVSAAVLGTGNTVGSAVLAIWTAQLVPDRPGTAFTGALVTGSLAAVATPAVIGALAPAAGLPAVLLGVATLVVVTAVGLAAGR